ncbi:MAG: aminoacyl-tRNA hydrolase [Chromatiaceae bacterium]|jgi:PTH1 family peptidyl-tRNA hydrolase
MENLGIRLIVGLGNPGPDYAATRHNVGFWFVDDLAAAHGGVFRAEGKFHGELCRLTIGAADVRLLKPATYMNRSGQSVAAVSRYFDIRPEAILIAHDELDLPVGKVRLKQGGGHAGHNGLRDTIGVLGSPDFWRLRIGIDHPGDRGQVVGYVLGRPTQEDAVSIRDALDQALGVTGDLLTGRYQAAMNRLHSGR